MDPGNDGRDKAASSCKLCHMGTTNDNHVASRRFFISFDFNSCHGSPHVEDSFKGLRVIP